MSSEPNEEPKLIEVDYEELREILSKEGKETKDILRENINKFDRSHSAYGERELRTEVYAQRGLNIQQHSIMRGFMKWQGTMHQMSYNLSLGLAISLGGIDKAVNAMRQKSWFEKYGLLVTIFVVGASMYFGFIYSPDFRVWLTGFFEPITTRVALAATLIVILYLWWRTRRKSQA